MTKNGMANLHNDHVWASENRHAIKIANSQTRFSVNVWQQFSETPCLDLLYYQTGWILRVSVSLLRITKEDLQDNASLAARRGRLVYQHGGCPTTTQSLSETGWIWMRIFLQIGSEKEALFSAPKITRRDAIGFILHWAT